MSKWMSNYFQSKPPSPNTTLFVRNFLQIKKISEQYL